MFLKTGEEKILSTKEALDEALAAYEECSKWLFPVANEISCIGLSDTPILTLKEKAAVVDSCKEKESEEDAESHFNECVADSGLFLSLPDGSGVPGRNIYRPVRETALASVYGRSGTYCRCVRNTENKPKYTAWTAERRGTDVNDGFASSAEELKVLVSDGMVNFIGSDLYVILPYRDGVNAAERALSKAFESVKYHGGFISHEYFSAEWAVKSAETEAHRLSLVELGVIHPETKVEYLFRFGSSDIGESKMTGRMLLLIGGVKIPLGEAQGVWHKTTRGVKERRFLTSGDENGNSVVDFEYKLDHFLAVSLKENEDIIEGMGNRAVKHPKGCAQRLLETCSFIPAAIKTDVADGLPSDPGTDEVTEIDVYIAICGALEKMDGLYSAVQATEEVSKLLTKNFSAYDRPERNE